MAEFSITGVKKPTKPMVFELDIEDSPPPLVLLINPESLDTKFAPKVSETRVRWYDRRESGYVFDVHHDELTVLSASGKSAMFYTNLGITSEDREQTVGWENIQHLVALYRNNGMNFNSKPNLKSLINSVGRVVITYDAFIYRGSFDSFSLTETQEKPFNLEFSFEFKVTQTISTKGLSNSIMRNVLMDNDPRFRSH